jgi:hypothetical protein
MTKRVKIRPIIIVLAEPIEEKKYKSLLYGDSI